jgi:hypothetical protein
MKGLAARHLDLAIVAAAARESDLTPVPVPSTVNVWKAGSMPALTKVAVVYHSSTGTVFELANSVLSLGRRTPMPASDCSRARSLRPRRPSPRTVAGPITVPPPRTFPSPHEDILWADASSSAPDPFRQRLEPAKAVRRHARRPVGAGPTCRQGPSGFTKTATAHGEREPTLLAGYNSFHHSMGSSLLPAAPTPSGLSMAIRTARVTTARAQFRSATRPVRPRRIKASESLRSLPRSNPVSPLDVLTRPHRPRRPGVTARVKTSPCRIVGQPTSTTSR